MIYSQQAYDKEIATLAKNIAEEATATGKLLWHLGNHLFGCPQDIDKQLAQISKKLKYHKVHYAYTSVPVYDQKGRPTKGAQPLKIAYQLIDVTLVEDIATIDQAKLSKGRFILATNQLDKAALPEANPQM
ncbi:hypothetical protein [Candidatus Cardinium hertigii]|uniref:Uncharacterized protein n=1 Tax=Candidatus Cardinium hertigii TaxID=247481 RepID=A0A2Z3L8D5_9BACT|nr:hypothetical protein [Candidatus Cardinium hertigii]AWN81679.1 hypothetical protein DK880_00351 [Candidatus Cardinium hertigii]